MHRSPSSRWIAATAALAAAAFGRPLDAQHADRAEALRTIIAAERSFAAMAATHGIRDSFYGNIADDGVIFRPNAVAGKKVLEGRPSTRGPAALLWDPRWVDVAASGDFGLSTGPSEFWPNGKADTLVSRGTFVTVWKRTGNGPWRFAIDIGVGGQTTLDAGGEPRWPAAEAAPPAASPDSLRAALSALDRAVGNDTIGAGRRPRLLSLLRSDSRVLRDGQPTAIGGDAAASVIGRSSGVLSSTAQGGDIARSGDLAYTYGTYELAGAGGQRQAGNYMRIWKRGADGPWKVALDIASPVG